MLKDHQIDLNLKDEEGKTALHHSVLNEDVFMIYKLLIKGADFFVKDNEGFSSYELSLLSQNRYIKNLFVF